MGAEPGLRVFLVRIYDKPWIRREIIRRPFPYIADHLAAAEGAIAARVSADFGQTGAPVQVSALSGGRIIAPGKMTPAVAQAVGFRFRRGGCFPFRLCRQSPTRPIAVGLGFVPADMNDRQIFIERDILIEDPLGPSAGGFAAPIDRMINFLFKTRLFPRFADVLVKKLGEGIFEIRRRITM